MTQPGIISLFDRKPAQMTRSSTLRLCFALSAIALPFSATASFAQDSAALSTAGAPSETSSAESEPALTKAASAQVEKQITQLHSQLGITSAELPQWNQFAQVIKDNAEHINAVLKTRASKMTSLSASENMKSYADIAQVNAANMNKLAEAFQVLYTALPEQQRQVADNVFRKTNAAATAHKG